MDLASRFPAIGLALLGGAALGVVFFGGLWLTVRRLERHRRASALFAASLMARSAVLLAGLWWFGRGEMLRMLGCAAGVLILRPVFVWGIAPSAHRASAGGEEEVGETDSSC